jgi:hypothetical protein
MISRNATIDLRVRAAFAFGLATFGVLMMSGCSGAVSIGGEANTYSNAATLSGVVHGGQMPVGFATVKLYAAGTSGYGAGATLLATATTSATTGDFTFTKSATNGSSSGTGVTWACPATTDDPIIYLIAQGGSSDGVTTLDAADTNSAIALLAVAGPCSGVNNNQFIVMDEISTAASVLALAPYINPGTTAGTEVIGTNGKNVATSTPQAAIGLNNAVAAIGNLTSTSASYTGTASTTTGVTVTATPEAGKIVTIANILAACINNATLPNALCTQLFNGAISLTGAKAVDTIQAAYYMATNPADLGTQTSCTGSTTNIGCLYNLAGGTPPFQNGLTAQPTDWTIGVTYSAVGSCTGLASPNGLFLDGPTHAAVDANGNIWVMNQTTTGNKAALVEMSPVGKPLACLNPDAQTYGSNVTIDPSGNVWGLWSHGTVTGELEEIPYNATTGTYTTGSPVAYTPLGGGGSTNNIAGLVADIYGNIFYSAPVSGGTLYEIPAPGASTTAVAQLTVASSLNGSTTSTPYTYLAADAQGRVWGVSSAALNLLGAYPTTATITGYSVTSNVVTFTAANSFTANVAGQTVVIEGLTSANGTQFNNQSLTITAATGSSFSAAFTTANVASTTDTGTAVLAGASAYTTTASALATTSYGLALSGDTAANTYIYTGTTCCGSGAAHEASKFQSSATAVASTGASSAQYVGGTVGARAVAVDGAGNMWIGQAVPETGTTINAGTYGVAEVSAVTGSGPTHVTFTGVSPNGTAPATCTTAAGCPANGGFQKASFTLPLDIELDPSGNVWVLDTATNSSAGTLTYISGTASTITEIVGAATPIATPLSAAAKSGLLGARP